MHLRTLVAAAVFFATAACGASEGGSDGADTSQAETDAFIECMRDNGIDMEAPAARESLRDSYHSALEQYEQSEIESAMEACHDKIPTG